MRPRNLSPYTNIKIEDYKINIKKISIIYTCFLNTIKNKSEP